MELNVLQEKVIALIAKQLHIEVQEIKSDSTLESLGADSLDLVELVMNLEEEFHIEIRDEDAEKLQSVHDVVVYIASLKK